MAKNLKLVLGVFSILIIYGCQSESSDTEIYLVRHAEKVIWDSIPEGEVYNPPLNESGKQRAEDLKEYFSNKEIDAIYSTEFDRNMETVRPLASDKNLEILHYEAQEWQPMYEEIQEYRRGENIMICGHSNNLIPIINAFNNETPIDSIGEDEYDMIFHIVKSQSGKVEFSILKY